MEKLETELLKVSDELKTIEAKIDSLRSKQQKLSERKSYLLKEIDDHRSKNLSEIDWCNTKYEWTEKVIYILNHEFGIEQFRPQQLSAINSTLASQNVIVVMPTGAGKSLCYQLPALIRPGLTVVVSPLISLMEDQVRSLTFKNIAAKLITSTTPLEVSNAVINEIKNGNGGLKLLYVTPERFAKSKKFMSALQKCYSDKRLQRFAIDEVHCCSQWGHDFRPDYKYLGILSSMFPDIPIIGLTATATSNVISDVQKMLKINGCLIIKSTFNRANLYYRIIEKPSSQIESLDLLEKLLTIRYKNQSGIIYVNSIKDCEDLTKGLRERGLKVNCYHAVMAPESRTAVHLKWHENKYQAIVATVAFGMGIDKPDVRFVLHYSLSKSIENYYQESGRAGRDGLNAECLTMYRLQDVFKNSTMIFSQTNSLEHLYALVRYCLNGSKCRRQIISKYFDESWGKTDCNKMCDICENGEENSKEIEIINHFKDIVQLINNAEKLDTKLTAQKLLDAWFCKGPSKLRHKGKPPMIPRTLAEDIVAFLLVEGFLTEDFHFTAYSTISYIKTSVTTSKVDLTESLIFKIRNYKELNPKQPFFTEKTIIKRNSEDVGNTISKKRTKL